jgi:hypothetical protein
MVLSGVGASIGAITGFVLGYAADHFAQMGVTRTAPNPGLMYGALVGVGAAAVGAIVGGVGDILAFLRKSHLPRDVHETDYR